MALTGKIEFEDCKTLADVEDAIQEALRRILDGNTSGMDRNESGRFYFEVSGEDEDEWTPPMTTPDIKARLEELRQAIRDEYISYGEIAELQSLSDHIEFGDVELLQWAGVSEEDARAQGRI